MGPVVKSQSEHIPGKGNRNCQGLEEGTHWVRNKIIPYQTLMSRERTDTSQSFIGGCEAQDVT